jgi:hypothetical protein
MTANYGRKYITKSPCVKLIFHVFGMLIKIIGH